MRFIGKNIKCASPTCARIVVIDNQPPRSQADIDGVLRRFGWVKQQQPGDDRPLSYCARCAQ